MYSNVIFKKVTRMIMVTILQQNKIGIHIIISFIQRHIQENNGTKTKNYLTMNKTTK